MNWYKDIKKAYPISPFHGSEEAKDKLYFGKKKKKKKKKVAFPVTENSEGLNYFDIGHDSYFALRQYNGKNINSYPKQTQEMIRSNMGKDLLFYVFENFAISIVPAFEIDSRGYIIMNMHQEVFGEAEIFATGRYNKDLHEVSLAYEDFGTENPRRIDYIKNGIQKVLDSTFNNPKIYEL